MRKVMTMLFVVGVCWLLYHDRIYCLHRMCSYWAVVAHRLPETDQVTRNMAVELLQDLNSELHKWHNVFYLPIWLVVGSASVLIFAKREGTSTPMPPPSFSVCLFRFVACAFAGYCFWVIVNILVTRGDFSVHFLSFCIPQVVFCALSWVRKPFVRYILAVYVIWLPLSLYMMVSLMVSLLFNNVSVMQIVLAYSPIGITTLAFAYFLLKSKAIKLYFTHEILHHRVGRHRAGRHRP